MARKATIVLPDPTSPCNKRCIGCGCARSDSISLHTATCPAVNSKGKVLSNASSKPPLISNVGLPDLWVAGDSVILGIRYELGDKRNIALINARVGRQAPELLEVLNRDKLAVGDIPVIFNLGNNNALTRTQVAAVFNEIANQSQIIVVNTAVPRPWREANNSLIAEYAAANARARVVDWAAISSNHPEFFAPDGVHLRPAGIKVYVAAILEALNK